MAIVDENSLDYVVLMLAAGKIGAVTVPVNYRLAGPELQFVIDDCEAALLVGPVKQVLATIDRFGIELPYHVIRPPRLVTERYASNVSMV